MFNNTIFIIAALDECAQEKKVKGNEFTSKYHATFSKGHLERKRTRKTEVSTFEYYVHNLRQMAFYRLLLI